MSKIDPKNMADQSANSAPRANVEPESLDKIRDILFGQQIREAERTSRSLEERLFKSIVDLREDTAKRLGALESYAKQEFDALNDRAKNEQSERQKGDRELSTELDRQSKALEKRLAELDEKSADAFRDIRKQILDQSKALRDEQQQRAQEINATIQRVAGELRHEKADRFALADLLQETALKLKDEFNLPKK